MVATASSVQVGVTGVIFTAPTGTALPSTPIAALNTAFYDVGYISEEGVTTSTSTDTTDIKAWQNGDTVRTIQTSHSFTVQFTMLETNPKSLEVYYGNYTPNSSGSNPGVVQVRGEQGYRGEWVIDVEDDDDLIRIVLPDAQVSERGDVVYVNAEAIQYPVTLTTYPDASQVKAYLYFETDAAS